MKQYRDFVKQFFSKDKYHDLYLKIISRIEESNTINISGLEISSFSLLLNKLYHNLDKNLLVFSPAATRLLLPENVIPPPPA